MTNTNKGITRSVVPLYMAVFLMALGLSVWWISLPFIIKRLGGTDGQVGICFALYMGVYAAGCILAGSVFKHSNPKRIAQIVTLLLTLLAAALYLIIAWA